jgi:plastocyanin
MKKIFKNKFTVKPLFIIYLFAVLCTHTNSTIFTVNTADFSFNPVNITSAVVGDTIKWQWLNGSHTTTSLTIPAGAAPWDHALTGSSQTFFYKITVAGQYQYKCTPHFPGMQGSFTAAPNAIIINQGIIPAEFKLLQNFPNPFNPTTKIRFDIPQGESRDRFVKLVIYDQLGREIASLVNESLKPGSYESEWDATNFSSGIYFYKLTTEDFIETKRMILVK